MSLAISLVIFAGGASVLTGLESHRIALHYSTLAKTVDFSHRHPDAEIWVTSQATSSGFLANLLAGIDAGPGNLSMIQPSTFAATLQARSPRERFVVVDPSSRSSCQATPCRLGGSLNRALAAFQQLSPESSGPGAMATRMMAWLRKLPAAIDRQLRFTDDLIAPKPATVIVAPNVDCPDDAPR